MVKPIDVARVAHAAIEKANEIKEKTSDTNVQTLMDNVAKAGQDAIKAVVAGELSQALSAKNEVEGIDDKAVGDVSPELCFIVNALENSLKRYVRAAGVDLEVLAELEQTHPDVASAIGSNVELPKITADDVLQMATEAAKVGDVGEAKALADLASTIQQLVATGTSSGTSSGSGEAT